MPRAAATAPWPAFPPGAAPQALEADNRVLALARLVASPLEIAGSETGWLARKLPIADVRLMRDAAIELIVPIGSDAGDEALFVLGSKRSEEPYTEDDGELLMAIGDSIAIRLSVARPGEIRTDPLGGARPSALLRPTRGRWQVRRCHRRSGSRAEGFKECPTCGGCYEAGIGPLPHGRGVAGGRCRSAPAGRTV